MKWTLLYFTCFIVMLLDIQWTAAQLSQRETLANITQCDLNADINVVCATNEMIAFHSLQYAYDARCDGICCDYSSTDCLQYADVTDIQTIRRLCSGRQSCTLPDLSDRIIFDSCSLSVQDVSYVFLQYYCIPENRITSICSSGVSITSDNATLYVTNNNYPSVTTGSTSCSCSLEVYSCSSSINIYIVDADLYLDTSTCEQNLEFLDGSGQTLYTIGCENHYKDHIETTTSSSHYAKINFINNSTQNQEGYFFIGLEGSESGVSFKLSCNYEQEMWCIGCGDVPTITNGKIELQNANNSSYGAQANVVCDSGYETNTSTISCLADGTWPSATCTEKAACTANQWRCTNGDCISESARCDNVSDCADGSDELNCNAGVCPEDLKSCPHANGTTVCVDKAVDCSCGSVTSIDNGVITAENSTIGSVADVTCSEGFDPSKETVTCLTSGQWETATCTSKGENGNGENRKNGGLAGGEIAAIIISVILVVGIIGGIILYVKKHAAKSTTEMDNTKVHHHQESSEVVQPDIVSSTQTPSFSKRTPLPEITKQHEIKHGHIYIEHDEAHIFGRTIHLPFLRSNRLAPITSNENE